MAGWICQQGEFWKVTPSMSTFSQWWIATSTGRRKSRMRSKSSLLLAQVETFWSEPDVAPNLKFSDGYHVLPSSERMPPLATLARHWPSVSLPRLTARQASPLPSMTPKPVMATFLAFMAEMGDWQRQVLRPSNVICVRG